MKEFTVNFMTGSVVMNNFEYFSECIFENTFKNLSSEEIKALLDPVAMKQYVDTLDEVYQDDDEDTATLPLSDEEKAQVAKDLREAIVEVLREEEEEEDE